MKTKFANKQEKSLRPTSPKQCRLNLVIECAFIIAGILFLLAPTAQAFVMPPGFGTNSGPVYTPLNSWSFYDSTSWTDDKGYAPVSFTNLSWSYLGNGSSLEVDTNVPAWLQYNVYENDGRTNLTVDAGTVMFWFAPSSWSSTNLGGSGPGEYGRLLEVGGYATDSSFGWWSIYVDDVGQNVYFSAQTNDLSGTVTTYFSAPIAWTTNYFHHLALTYSATNTALYLDGGLVTNGPPMTVYPGPDVLANGLFIGSDSNGVYQAHGMFDTVVTYSVPLDADTIQETYNWQSWIYYVDPLNKVMMKFGSAPSTPSYGPIFNAVTGSGYLTAISTNTSDCVTSSNVWITNTVAMTVGTNMTVRFTIAGGSNAVPYDVFATSVLSFGTNGVPWAWMGQGYQCVTYTLTNLPSSTCFLILGTPQDSDGDGLTDAYERLVSKTDPNNPNSSGDGILDGWKVLWGLNPLLNNPAQPGLRANFMYDGISRLKSDTGIVNEAFGFDAQGNIQLDQP